jgi:hypothetical protein
MSVPRFFGVGLGLVIGAVALAYLWFSLGLYLHEPGVSDRGAKCILASLPFLITVMIVFLSFYSANTSFLRAVVYTLLAELLMCLMLLLFAWGLARTWQAQVTMRSSEPGWCALVSFLALTQPGH